MRIAYLTEWPPYVQSGVLQKMSGQVEAWRAAGHEAQIFTLVPLQSGPTAPGFDAIGRVIGTFRQDQLERFPRARLGFLNKIVSVPKLRAALAAFAPDVIYYRQNGPWYPGLGSILRRYPSVAEINTLERAENKLWGAGFRQFQAMTRRRVLGSVDGLVCVTGEIAEHERWPNAKSAVVPNGFWGPPRDDMPPTRNAHPAYVFAGSPMSLDHSANWQGADKLLPLAAALPESSFHIAGMTKADFAGLDIPPNVIFHGFLSSGALTNLYRQCDVGIGALASYRKQLEEGCSLKVRDYLMHRLPVILAYRDTQPELNIADFTMNIGNVPDNVTDNIDRIAAFGERWRGRRVESDLGFLSRESIEQRRLDFMSMIAESSVR